VGSNAQQFGCIGGRERVEYRLVHCGGRNMPLASKAGPGWRGDKYFDLKVVGENGRGGWLLHASVKAPAAVPECEKISGQYRKAGRKKLILRNKQWGEKQGRDLYFVRLRRGGE